MENKDPITHINVQLDQEALETIINTFSYMAENYDTTGVIDHAAWIINKQELEDTVAKLKPYANSDANPVEIPMGYDDWNTYSRLIDYAGYAAPEQQDRELLEDLFDSYSDLEDEGMVPAGPV